MPLYVNTLSVREMRRLDKLGKRLVFYAFILIIVVCFFSTLYIETEESKLPSLIRLHIIANSDSASDQELKYKVKDDLVKLIREDFKDSQSIGESREILLNEMSYLETKAKESLVREGYDYKVQAVFGRFCFPTKYYGSFALPAGEYEALRIIIGEGKGANWWCVLFPPLCFVDGERSLCIQDDITEELVNEQNQRQVIKIKPALKIVELWKEVMS